MIFLVKTTSYTGSTIFEIPGTLPEPIVIQINMIREYIFESYETLKPTQKEFKELIANLEKFTMLTTDKSLNIIEASRIKSNGKSFWYVSFFVKWEARTISPKGHVSISYMTETFQYVLNDGPQNIGHIKIRPETFTDKIACMIYNEDIDFRQHPKFSSRYYTVASSGKDEKLFRKNMPKWMIELFESYKFLHSETVEDKMLTSTVRNITLDDAKNLLSIADTITSH
jgi:hypothetical protein